VHLDGDLPPVSMSSGIAGLEELSTVNRALGVLIGRGHHPQDAQEILRRGAYAAGTDIHQFAGRLLGRWGRVRSSSGRDPAESSLLREAAPEDDQFTV
jgi:hypothetical protein